jgi:hypothetical protein
MANEQPPAAVDLDALGSGRGAVTGEGAQVVLVPLSQEDQKRVACFLRGIARDALVAAGGAELGFLRVTANEWAALGSAFDAITAINTRIEREPLATPPEAD